MSINISQYTLLGTASGVNFYTDLPTSVHPSLQSAINIKLPPLPGGDTPLNWSDHAMNPAKGVIFTSLGGQMLIMGTNGNNFPGDRYSKTPLSLAGDGSDVTYRSGGFDVLNIAIADSSGQSIKAGNLTRTAVHELLHDSPVIESWVSQDMAKVLALTPNMPGRQKKEVAAAIEHVIISQYLNVVSQLNPGLLKFDNANNLKGYKELLESALLGFDKYGNPIDSAAKIRADQLLYNYELSLDGFQRVVAEANGQSFRPDGQVAYWRDDNGKVYKTDEKSNYSDKMLDLYGRSNDKSGTADMSLGGHFRALGDWLGFDGKFGLDGTFAKPAEGNGERGGSGSSKTSSDGSSKNGGSNGSNGSSKGGLGAALKEAWQGFKDFLGIKPILLDLDGDGVQITELSRSTRFVDAGGDGLLHRTAWAAAGNGVLFFDPDGRNAITEKRQYVFTEWNPTASGDLEALRSVWDTNGDGKLTAADADFAKFKVLVTNADGSVTVRTLAYLGITEINLTADTTNIALPDGSMITGQTPHEKLDARWIA